MANIFETGQALTIAATAVGTLFAQAGLEWVKNHIQARDRRNEASDSVVIRQVEINAEATEHLHDWWAEEVKQGRELFQRAVFAEAERDALKREIERLESVIDDYGNEVVAKRGGE